MNSLKGKTTTLAAALLMILAMAVALFALPAEKQYATAQDAKATYSYIGAVPNPVGVGQTCLIHVGMMDQHPGGAGYGWEGLTVEVTRPDLTTETLGPFTTDSTGGTGHVYVPNQEGTYKLQTHFPEQWYNYTDFWGNLNENLYYASESDILELVVQTEAIPYYPSLPLPAEYWVRPIDSQLREWNVIAGSWLTCPENFFAPYNEGPETAHILWTKPLTIGGLVGGEYGPWSFEVGDAYEGKWTGSESSAYGWHSSAIIVAGKLIYQHLAEVDPIIYHCVDLRTGEELWAKTFLDNRTIDFGQLFYWDSFNMHGAFAYLWVSVGDTWHAFDVFSGDWRYSMYDVPDDPDEVVFGPKGELYIYDVSLGGAEVSLWNSSLVGTLGRNPPSVGSWGDWVHERTLNASRGIQWTKPIPADLQGSVQKTFFNDRIIGASINNTHVHLWGISTAEGQEGTLLFKNTWRAPAYWESGNVTIGGFGGGWQSWSQEDKVGVMLVKETLEHYGFSLETGEYLWGPSTPTYYLDAIEDTKPESRAIAYGRFYVASVSGIVYCYNVTTGELLWTYEATDPYQEILWANTWWQKPLFITDGKIYTGHYEHSPIDPRPRGAPFLCLNATTGEVIWRADGLFRQTRWGGRAIIGDSVIATMDTYDQRVYAIAKGPSATTVAAAPKVSVHGSSVMVEGMVTDISPGTKEYALTARFPNGVPAVSDESMSEYMLYVYKNFAHPHNVTGVEVVVEVLDPNNNFYEVGTTTSDATGFYSVMFTPEVPGKYTVITSFRGSKAYYGSWAKTAFGVDAAPEPTPEPTPTPAPMTDTYVTGFGIGIIIAIVVVGLLLFLLLRKR